VIFEVPEKVVADLPKAKSGIRAGLRLKLNSLE